MGCGPLNIRMTDSVKDYVKQLLKDSKFGVVLKIENDVPILRPVDVLLDPFNYICHEVDENIKIYVCNRNIWELFHCYISTKEENIIIEKRLY
tara:strand:- start:8599 stop:8877 length:279 start_codon:yes stop_codon:yes gene_type:complete